MRKAIVLLMSLGAYVLLRLLSQYQAAHRSRVPYALLINERWLITYTVAILLAAFAFGLPDVPATFGSSILAAVAACVLAAMVFSAFALVFGPWLLPRFVVLFSPVLNGPWLVMCSSLSRRSWRRSTDRERILLIGDFDDFDRVTYCLQHRAEKPGAIVAHMTLDEATPNGARIDPIADIVKSESATLLVLTEEAQQQEAIVGQVVALHSQGVRVRTVVKFYEEWLGKLPITELTKMHLLFDIGQIHDDVHSRTKRLVDMAAGLVGMPLLLLTLPFVLVGNLLGNRGPLLFSQERVGLGGRVFRIHKFRTMKPHSQAGGAGEWTAEGDPRITRFGALLRKTHLDELPQFWNIVRGELSLVGPRPEQVHYVERLRQSIPHYELRESVRPGMTGWAQVKYPYGSTEEDAREKLEYELFYIAKPSSLMDFRIIWRTFRSVLTGAGR